MRLCRIERLENELRTFLTASQKGFVDGEFGGAAASGDIALFASSSWILTPTQSAARRTLLSTSSVIRAGPSRRTRLRSVLILSNKTAEADRIGVHDCREFKFECVGRHHPISHLSLRMPYKIICQGDKRLSPEGFPFKKSRPGQLPSGAV